MTRHRTPARGSAERHGAPRRATGAPGARPRPAVPKRRTAAPAAPSSTINVLANERGLERVSTAYDRFARARKVPDNVRRDVYVALEEIVSNVVRHAAIERTPKVRVTLAIARGAFTVDIVDDGPPFDPFAAAPVPDVDAPLLERPIGGLGVLFVGSLTDAHTYDRDGDHNHVSLRRALKRPRRTTLS